MRRRLFSLGMGGLLEGDFVGRKARELFKISVFVITG